MILNKLFLGVVVAVMFSGGIVSACGQNNRLQRAYKGHKVNHVDEAVHVEQPVTQDVPKVPETTIDNPKGEVKPTETPGPEITQPEAPQPVFESFVGKWWHILIFI